MLSLKLDAKSKGVILVCWILVKPSRCFSHFTPQLVALVVVEEKEPRGKHNTVVLWLSRSKVYKENLHQGARSWIVNRPVIDGG